MSALGADLFLLLLLLLLPPPKEVTLFVCMSARLLEKFQTDFDEIFWSGGVGWCGVAQAPSDQILAAIRILLWMDPGSFSTIL